MKLLIVRHAIALDREEWSRLSSDDRQRPLTEVGAKKMAKAAKGLTKILSHEPDSVISSPLLRAKQTAEILLNEMPSAKFALSETLSPDYEPQDFVDYLKRLASPNRKPKIETVVCVGHEPHLNHLISWIVSKSRNGVGEMKKGGACLIEFNDEIKAGSGRLVWLLTARQLRDFA